MSKKVIDSTLARFKSDYNCAQSVLISFLEHKGLLFEEAVHLSAGLGGGVALQGNTCGAVTGGVLAIGMLMGQTISNVGESKYETYKVAMRFLKRFKSKFSTQMCNDLVGLDMADPKQLQTALDKGHFQKTCPKYVEGAVSILLDMFP
ncbi:MAG: C-GCAxxG-C-C family protein [Candidatus Thorarchaeota archaeon]|jgi:C_GCAxxG_C_C family probable redox protein